MDNQNESKKQSSTLPSKRVCVVFEEVPHPQSPELLFLKVFIEPENRPLDEKWAVCDDPTLAEIWAGETMELITNYLQREMLLDGHNEFSVVTPSKKDMN